MEFSNSISATAAMSHSTKNESLKPSMADLPGASFFGANAAEAESVLAGLGTPAWSKNNSKIYVVAYPSDVKSLFFMVDATKPTNRSLGAGYGIFVQPKKISKAKFWIQKQGLPALFTIEGGGPAPGLTVRYGPQWGVNGMLVRFLIDSKDNPAKIGEVNSTLQRVAEGTRSGDETWLREALIALTENGLIGTFHVAEFIDLVKSIVQEQLEHGANWMQVLTVDYEAHINKRLA